MSKRLEREKDASPTTPETPDERRRKAAALMGAGLSTKRIADALAVTERGARKICRRVESDSELLEILRESRLAHMPKVLEVASLALDAMKRGLVDGACPVHHAAAAYRELARASSEAHASIVAESQLRAGAPGPVGLDGCDAATIAELLLKLRQHELDAAASEASRRTMVMAAVPRC